MSRLIFLLAIWGAGNQAFAVEATKLLMSCNVQAEDIGFVEIYYSSDRPAFITVVHNGNQIINTTIQQWHQKNITLPSQERAEYQLIKVQDKWVMRQCTIDSLKYFIVNCR
ncbi:MAG: hypothetical protein IPM57_04160 [Oligoflexia bacterium]|nr:hypothetical protein [Oligoflexia bacterium]